MTNVNEQQSKRILEKGKIYREVSSASYGFLFFDLDRTKCEKMLTCLALDEVEISEKVKHKKMFILDYGVVVTLHSIWPEAYKELQSVNHNDK